jgi:hypothetical protein
MRSRKELYAKKRYGVFACYHCHQWQGSNLFQKTHQCVKCGKTLSLVKVDPVLETDEVDEAIHFLQALKRREELKKNWGTFTSADKLLS